MNEILQLIDEFISSNEKSLLLANNLEMALDDAFADDDVVQRAVEALAAYRPEGREYLFDANTIVERLRATKNYLIGLK